MLVILLWAAGFEEFFLPQSGTVLVAKKQAFAFLRAL
jgi:hypothetical protein